jgi:hypothetical protein
LEIHDRKSALMRSESKCNLQIFENKFKITVLFSRGFAYLFEQQTVYSFNPI